MTIEPLAKAAWAGALLLSGALMTPPALAQSRGSLFPGQPVIAPPKKDQDSDRRERPLNIVVLKPATPAWTLAKLTPPEMAGWTQLTDGATKGGPSVIQVPGGQTRLIVRGADDILYSASINPAAPVRIDPSRWESLGITARSEPSCQPVVSFGTFACAYLGSSGDARFAVVGLGVEQALGGSNASGRPALVSVGGKSANNSMSISVKLMVLGNQTMFLRSLSGVEETTGIDIAEDTGWTKMAGGYVVPAQCESGQCAWMSDIARIVLGDPFDQMPGLPAQPFPDGLSTTPLAPVKLASGKYAVFARGINGHIYRTATGGGFSGWTPWVDEGGALALGSSMACLANGEQPLCFVQATDGRIYARKLGTASGL